MVWSYPTNYSNGTSVTGPGGFFMDYPSAIISEHGGGILVMVFLAIFAVSSFMGAKKALLVSCFITGIISMYFAVSGWINAVVPISFGVVTIIIIILALLEGKGGGL